MEVESSTICLSNGISAGRRGREPLASTMTVAESLRVFPAASVTMCIMQCCSAGYQRHAAAQQTLQDDQLLLRDHALLEPHSFDQQAVAATRTGTERTVHTAGTREQIRHLAQRLTGDGAGLQARTAYFFLALYDGGTFAHARSLPCRVLSGQTGADDDDVVVHIRPLICVGTTLLPYIPSSPPSR